MRAAWRREGVRPRWRNCRCRRASSRRGDEDEDSDYEPAETFNHLDVPAALSHFSYSVSQGRKLLCDIQGV